MRQTLVVALVSVALAGLSVAPAAAADCTGPVNICPSLGVLPIGPVPVTIPQVGPFQVGPFGPFNFCIPLPIPGFPPCPK
jgi:hypothetical protein